MASPRFRDLGVFDARERDDSVGQDGTMAFGVGRAPEYSACPGDTAASDSPRASIERDLVGEEVNDAEDARGRRSRELGPSGKVM